MPQRRKTRMVLPKTAVRTVGVTSHGMVDQREDLMRDSVEIFPFTCGHLSSSREFGKETLRDRTFRSVLLGRRTECSFLLFNLLDLPFSLVVCPSCVERQSASSLALLYFTSAGAHDISRHRSRFEND